MSFHVNDYNVTLSILSIIFILVGIASIVTSAIAIIRIVQRAGFSGWWALVIFLPVLNMLALWYFGFGHWPILRAPNTPIPPRNSERQ